MHCRWLVSQFSSALTFSVLGLSVNGSRNSSSDWPLSIWRSGRSKDRKRKTTTMNAMSMTIAICTGASDLTSVQLIHFWDLVLASYAANLRADKVRHLAWALVVLQIKLPPRIVQ